MKLKLFFSTLMALFFTGAIAQDRTTVSATSSEISDNLDLRAVASIFGDSRDLEDFENRLNDPKNQISNLDLNSDNQVDYLRVIETVEGLTHIIVVQSVLGRDLFQDVATIEVEKDGNNRVQVQVVGDVYMYGTNYIYEPVYVHTPIIYAHFYRPYYRPYCSAWYWGYYPSYYYAWHPFPVFRYRSHIALHINFGHHYNYVTHRRCLTAYNHYYARRANGYERQYPDRSFASRNASYANRHELDSTRNIRTVGTGRSNGLAESGTRSTRQNTTVRQDAVGTRTIGRDNSSRSNTSRDIRAVGTAQEGVRNNPSRSVQSGTRSQTSTQQGNPYGSTRSNNSLVMGGTSSGPSRNIASTGTRSYQDNTVRSNPSRNYQTETPRGNNRSEASRSYSDRPRQGASASANRSYSSNRGGEASGRQNGGSGRGAGDENRGGRR